MSKLGLYAEGERELRLAAAQNPKSPDVLAALGHALISQGQLDDAWDCEFCDAALAVDLVTVALPGEFGKPRPAVVVQSDLFARHTTVTVLPVTSTVTRPAPLFRLPLEPSSENGLQAPSCVMVDKTMSVRANRNPSGW